MQRPRSMWWRLKRWKAVIKTWLPALFPSRSMLDWYWVLRWALTPCQNLPGRSDMLKLDRWWILHHPQIGLISGAVVLLDEKLWYCRIHIHIHKHIACLILFVDWHYFSVFCFHRSFLYTMDNKILNTLQVTLLMISVSDLKERLMDDMQDHARSERWHRWHQRGG